MENKPNYCAIIPAEVRYDKRLKANAKLLYGEITALSNKEGYCWASNNYFSDLYEVTPQAISNWIKALEKNGYISIDYIKKGKQIIKRNIRIEVSTYIDRVSINDSGGINKCLGGYKQMFKENTTSISTTTSNNINTRATPQKNDKYESIVEEILKTKTEDFRESVREYIKMRNKIKKPATAFALKNILNKLKAMTSDELKQIAILNQSTDSSHQRIYELKDSTFGKVEVEKGVFITEDEETEFLKKYDSVFYGQMTDKLSDYKLQSGKTYFNDFTALNGWVLSECIKEWRAAGKKFEK